MFVCFPFICWLALSQMTHFHFLPSFTSYLSDPLLSLVLVVFSHDVMLLLSLSFFFFCHVSLLCWGIYQPYYTFHLCESGGIMLGGLSMVCLIPVTSWSCPNLFLIFSSLTVPWPCLLLHPLNLSTPSPSLGFLIIGGGGYKSSFCRRVTWSQWVDSVVSGEFGGGNFIPCFLGCAQIHLPAYPLHYFHALVLPGLFW